MTTHTEGEESKTSSTQDQKKEDDDKPPDTDLPSIQDEPAGLTVEGDWDEITDFCEQFNYTLETESRGDELPAKHMENWNDWHPGEDDDQEEIKERSASHAAYSPDSPPKKDFKESASHLDSSRNRMEKGEGKKAFSELLTAAKQGAKGILSHFVKTLGKLEHFIYRYVITKANSCYFDSEFVSANLEDQGKMKDEDYKIQVKIHDEELREKVSEELQG